jgi:hypothetical protein
MEQTFLTERNVNFVVSKEKMDEIREFAKKQFVTTLSQYKTRHQEDRAKIEYDCITGKTGEWGAYKYLISVGLNCTTPDMKIYQPLDKTWAEDMTCDGGRVNVKSQTDLQADRFGLSWTFQFSGDGGGNTDKIFKKYDPRDLYIFTKVTFNEDGSASVEIMSVIHVSSLFTLGLFDDPVNPKLVGIKKAVYYNKLKASTKSLFVV